MNAKQKYLFDLNGYLHLKDVLATVLLHLRHSKKEMW